MESTQKPINGGDGPPKNPSTTSTSIETANLNSRFVLVKVTDGNFDKVSPFIISKTLYGLVGEIKSVKKIKEGLLIQTTSNAQTKRLLEVKRFAGLDVSTLTHPTLNSSRGVIFCHDLLNCTTEEIVKELEPIGVTNVRRLKTRKDGILVDSPSHVLTFNTPKLPDSIKVAYYKLNIRPYIPPPVRCFQCQLFGHVAQKCPNNKICACGKEPHDPPCIDPKKCVNCEGSHSANYKNCPKYKIEEAIQRIKVTEKVTYSEAKKKVIVNTPITNVSYATASKNLTPQVNVENLISNFIPQIESIIKKVMTNIIIPQPPLPPLPSQSTELPPPRYSLRHKRTRSESSDIESLTSETQYSSQAEKTKKKHKQKRGRPRKTDKINTELSPEPNKDSVVLPQIPLSPLPLIVNSS